MSAARPSVHVLPKYVAPPAPSSLTASNPAPVPSSRTDLDRLAARSAARAARRNRKVA